jgi:iron complex transport system substrate-binding protein
MRGKLVIILVVMGIIAVIGATVGFMNYKSNDTGEKMQITDMAGRTVGVPTEINRTFSIAGSLSIMLYMIAPDKMLGWNSDRNTPENQYMPDKYKNLPVLGGGTGDANYESIIAQNPDVVFIGHGGNNDTINKIQEQFGGIPALDVEGDNNLTSISSSIRFMGTVLQEEQKSNDLINFYSKVFDQVQGTVKSIPDSEKKKVYYTRDAEGLTTFGSGSPQTQLIELCGGVNVVPSSVAKGITTVSMEQIIQWNPDVIITSSSDFYNQVYSQSTWQTINAVKNKQVYLVPQSPFNWFESPPGANMIMGIPWTAKVLYPDKFQDMDIKSLTKEFYTNYYHYNLTDGDVNTILSSSGLTNF